MSGGGGWTRFYKYLKRGDLMFLVTKKGPDNEGINQRLYLGNKMAVDKWNFFALTYQKGNGVSIYLNGKLAARDAGMEPIQHPAWFRVGQSFGGDKEPNRVIDEFRIYDKALSGDRIFRKFLKEGHLRTNQKALVPETGARIVIDGKIASSEWKNATVISGLINNASASVAETQSKIYITYDKTYLYLAFRSDIPEAAKDMPEQRLLHGILKSTTLNHDTNVDFDDAFGIFIIPRYPEGKMYLLWVNGMETTYEYSISPRRVVSLKWNPKWDVKSRLDMEGWTVETRIPLKDLGVDTVKDGEVWKFQFLRNWKLLKNETDIWSYFSGPKKERGDGFGTVVFTGKKGLAVKVEEFSGVITGKVNLKTELRNVSNKEEVITTVLKAGNEILASKEYTLAPDDKVDFQSEVDLTQVKANMLYFDVKDKEGGEYYSQSIPYFIPRKLAVTLKKYPSDKILAVSWQLRKIDKKANRLGASVEIIPAGGGKTLRSKNIWPLASLDGSTTVSTKGVPAGKYRVRISIRERDNNKILVTKLVDYDKKPLPEWFGNDLGISDKVPPPWTPLEVKADAVKMWGRSYDFNGRLFPVQITNQGKKILSAPVSLSIKMADGTSAMSSDTVSRITGEKKSPVRVSSIRGQNLGGVEITSKSYIEFDGMMWMEIKVAPRDGRAAVKELTLTIPMKKKYAHLINAYDYSLSTTGELPERGYASAMGPRWVGDEEGGIQVFAETSYNWMARDKKRELEITNGEKEVAFKLHLIDKPVTLGKPLTFALGFIVTPVKKTVPDMRDILSINGRFIPIRKGIGLVGEYYKKAFKTHKGLEIYHMWQQGWWKTEKGYKGRTDSEGFYPVPHENMNKSYGIVSTNYGMAFYAAPYARLQQAWAASPEFEQFGDEWMSNINQLYIPNESIPRAQWKIQSCQNARSFQDFTLYGFNKLLNETKVRAFYFDVSKPHVCDNVYHGCGVMGAGGKPGYTTNFLGARRILRRVYTLLKKKHPDGLIFFHMSGQVVMPVYSFADALVDGENYASLLDRRNNRGYEKVLKLDQFAAEYAAQNNFGPYSVFLPEFRRSGAIRDDEWKVLGYQHAEYVLGLVFLSNSQLWFPANMPAEPTVKLYSVFDENGLDSSYTYLGYWKQQAVSLPDNLKASFQISPDKKKAFMIVMNFNWKDKLIDLRIDSAKLGMTAIDSARMLYPEGKVDFASGTVKRATIPAKNFRLYLLKSND